MPRAKKTNLNNSSSQRSLRTATVPDMFMKQKNAANKRRIIQQDESSEEEDELNPSENESESEYETSTQQTSKKVSRRKRANTKNVASNIVLNTSSQLLEQVSQNLTQASLYDKALIPECSIDEVVEGWVKQYKVSQAAALKDLINFVIRSSGCSMAITSEALEQDDGSFNALQELQEELAKLPHTEYPIVSKLKEFKTLRRNLLVFFQELIDQCQHDLIYDGVLIETLQNWLTTISTYRPFRHTATLIALKIINQLCVVGEKTRDELSIANRQLNAEKKKRTPNRDRMNGLKQKCTVAQRKCKDLEEYLTEFFESIFVHRSRDVESVIRTECFKELCNWMQNYQSFFVDNLYLRFFGWAFNDQSASVRSEAIKSITKLYKIEDIASKLSTFTNRFKGRIEEMALQDIDVSVRVNAIQLCSTLFKLKINILSKKGHSQLSSMIASDVPRVRKSAAPFVKVLIDTNMIDPLLKEVTKSLSGTNKGGRRSGTSTTNSVPAVNKSWVTFKAISSFLVEQCSNIIEKGNNEEMQVDFETLTSALAEKRNFIVNNIVEALWEQIPELQDYEAMSDYLRRDHSQSQQQQSKDNDEMDTGADIEDCYRLSEDEETILINVFVACIRTAMNKGLDKNLPENKDRKKLDDVFWEENKNELSRHLVQVLPKLLSKHLDDSNRLTQLVTLPSLMNLNVYLELRAEKEYEDLLQILVRVYLGAISTDLLTNCADSLQYMTKNTSLSEFNHIHLSDLKEAVVNQVREACNGKDLVTSNYTPALIHSISVSMLRLACLINFCDATTAMDDFHGMSMNTIEYVGALVDRAAFGNEKEKDISLSAMTVLSRYMMWKCHALSTTANTSDITPFIERRRDWVLDKFTELVKGVDVSPLPEVRIAAFGYLVDMYWLFNSDIFDSFGLTRLKTRCPNDLQKACANIVTEQVKKVNSALEDFDIDDEASKKVLTSERDLLYKLFTNFSRGVLINVFDMSYAVLILEQYGLNNTELDDIIKALISEFQLDLITGEIAADGICRAYLEALKNSFNANVTDSGRSTDKTMKLARLEANSLKQADQQDPVKKVPPQVICERIHIDGISFALSKAADAHKNNRYDERDNALKFFKILSIFGKELTRARDIARIHNHLEDCLQQNGLVVDENNKEWEHYVAYVQSIDQVLKKKGLRYDATKRANNAETPAAHVFTDVNLEETMEEAEEAPVRETNKRALTEVDMDMDIDDEIASKRRR
ncbi:uncharacterized protein BX663DRAFT_548130 [Cokeromyces recurvatus]|uniref:uncharacterized protein n=1 Tax=Cokeromyces recurvatus TaxID=90255 RepID=UPI00221E6FFB|nr:uncharacterized protein BX663DRAFT_548130 [Cokeromyces recurvatus]KAI7907039.1 hypothetical protein BX663DRAFT_548130 [Cokeromyces recurvatus]